MRAPVENRLHRIAKKDAFVGVSKGGKGSRKKTSRKKEKAKDKMRKVANLKYTTRYFTLSKATYPQAKCSENEIVFNEQKKTGQGRERQHRRLKTYSTRQRRVAIDSAKKQVGVD